MSLKITFETNDPQIIDKLIKISTQLNITDNNIPDSYFLSIFDLDLSANLITRITHCLIADEVYLLGDLAAMSERYLLNIPEMGRKSVYALRTSLAALGICLEQITSNLWNNSSIIKKRIETLRLLTTHLNDTHSIKHVIEQLQKQITEQ